MNTYFEIFHVDLISHEVHDLVDGVFYIEYTYILDEVLRSFIQDRVVKDIMDEEINELCRSCHFISTTLDLIEHFN